MLATNLFGNRPVPKESRAMNISAGGELVESLAKNGCRCFTANEWCSWLAWPRPSRTSLPQPGHSFNLHVTQLIDAFRY